MIFINSKYSTLPKDQKTAEHLRTKRLDLIYRQSTFSFLGNGIAGLLIIVLFWKDYNHTVLTVWLLANTLLLAFRGGISHLYNTGRLTGRSYEWYFNIFNAGSVLTGIIWSFIGIYICEFGSLYSSAIVLLTIAGLVAVSVALNSVSFPSFVAFSYSALAPVSVYYLMKIDFGQTLLGIFALLFLGVLTLMSYSLNKMIFKYFSYETDNINLIEKLDEEKRVIMKLNNELKNDLLIQKKIETELINEKLKVESLVEKLLKLSTIDGLTGIPNRRHFDEYMGKEWSRCAREQLPLSLIICDIDHFKAYNDRYGHLMGDNCLRKVASILSEHARRGGDMAARYGGEEFAIILPNTSKENATLLAHQVHQAIQDLGIAHQASPTDNVISVSFGVATIIPHRDSLSTVLIAMADKALYQAKQSGRNCVITMEPEIVKSIKSIA
jgi:diguanylate cyclase (GGDEF)-like protein